jgi:hypothetical protein
MPESLAQGLNFSENRRSKKPAPQGVQVFIQESTDDQH